MKTKKLIITSLIILFIFTWLSYTNATQTIYDKIDNLVLNNRVKAEKLYNLLWELRDYTWKKLWIKENINVNKLTDLNFSDIYWFNLNKILWYDIFSVSIFIESILKWLDLNNYWLELSYYILNTKG